MQGNNSEIIRGKIEDRYIAMVDGDSAHNANYSADCKSFRIPIFSLISYKAVITGVPLRIPRVKSAP